ncbi:MAG: hypothetical protein H6718_30350 [Polyangiaceae bacterium]|nr:hypothetical protein [Polyangiaceae bacterium]
MKPHREELEDGDEDDARERDLYERSLRHVLEYAKSKGITLDRPPVLPDAPSGELARDTDDD